MLANGESLADVGVEDCAADVKVGVRVQYLPDEGEIDSNPVLDNHLLHFLHQLQLLPVELRQLVDHLD